MQASDDNFNPVGLQGNYEDLNQAQDLFQMQDMAKLVRTYLEEDIPEDIKKTRVYNEMWAVLGRTIKLSFLDESDVQDFEFLYDECKINYVMSKPSYEFTFEDMQLLDQLRIYFLAALKRAKGVSQHRMNERTLLATQISQQIRSNTESFNQSSGGGILNKLKSWF